MKQLFEIHPWKIIENQFHPEANRVSESVFSIGNGRFGQRGNFEEHFTGQTLQGSYVAGVYYPDKTRVGWWKNGYPEYFAKVLNAPDWLNLMIRVNGHKLDLHRALRIHHFRRELDLSNGELTRDVDFNHSEDVRLRIQSRRICSMADPNLAILEYTLEVVEGTADISLYSGIDGTVRNADSNYDHSFWKGVSSEVTGNSAVLVSRTRKTDFHVGIAAHTRILTDQGELKAVDQEQSRKEVKALFEHTLHQGESIRIEKRIVIESSLNVEKSVVHQHVKERLNAVRQLEMADLFQANQSVWETKWEESDIVIEGDESAQQAIRFNIFQLNATYTGEDERLNIGPKGFTGEKYGGSTYWDTEAYCLPFYQATADEHVARNLLIYRYKHLQKAIENAGMLGFTNGAALYPMVTMNGEECHNEWEITFEEIHRNGAIAYAIHDYIRYTGDQRYLAEYGLEVLIGIARFWSQRVNWSEDKQRFVMLGVTGPNEFENNVNNNWYTNRIAAWCMQYAAECVEQVKSNWPSEWMRISEAVSFQLEECVTWMDIVNRMYYPFSEKHQVYLQQDGFLDKELISVSELDPAERPIVEHWSWDRILRSCYIKQADVLQGMYFFEEEFDRETIQRHYDFYEPLTVHESSLSPCVHSILAASLGDEKRAYEFYLRTARLDLDDYNNDTCDGLHITSMAGTWMSIVKGFAGMRVQDNQLTFKPFLPEAWTRFSFKIRFRGDLKLVEVRKDGLYINGSSTASKA
ncbi:MAG: glycoside hydrolase family 65 protein [Bacteroidetes bacterium]|nr:glycoside hydrolase family 65 protein [Bacteroidota bacterium]